MRIASYCLLACLVSVLIILVTYVSRRVYLSITRPNFKKLVEKRDLDSIAKLLNHKRPEIRNDAVLALAYLKEVDRLIVALESNPDSSVRALSAKCLGELQHPRAVQPLINALQNKKERGSAFGFGGHDIPQTSKSMMLGMGVNNGEVRSIAAWALGKLPSPYAMYPLIEAVKDNATVTAAAHALSNYDHPDSVRALIDVLEHDYWLAQVYAMDSLLQLGAIESIPYIFNVMKDEKSSSEVKETATVVLTRFVEGFEFDGKEELQKILGDQSSV